MVKFRDRERLYCSTQMHATLRYIHEIESYWSQKGTSPVCHSYELGNMILADLGANSRDLLLGYSREYHSQYIGILIAPI